MLGGWPETGFLREYVVTGEDSGKNPVSLVVRRKNGLGGFHSRIIYYN